MNNFEIVHSLKGLFQQKKRLPGKETVVAKQGWDDVFSYSFGEPDDDVMKKAFRMLRELKRKEETKKSGPDRELTTFSSAKPTNKAMCGLT